MTTQETIKRLCAIKGAWPDAAQDIDRLLADLEEQLRLEIASRAGNASATRVLTQVLKGAAKLCPTMTNLHYPWIDSEGRQCVCDSIQAYRLREHLPLIERPREAGAPLPLGRLVPNDLTGWKRLQMPSAKELRQFIAVARAKWMGKPKDFAAAWDFGPYAPTVRADLLLNAATVFPDAAELFWNTMSSPLVIMSSKGDGVICPMNAHKAEVPAQNDDERKAIEDEEKRREQWRADRKELEKQHVERNRAINKARHERFMAEHERKAVEKQLHAAKDDQVASLTRELAEKRRAEGLAVLNHHATVLGYDPAYSIDPDEFAQMVSNIYAA